MLSYLQAAILGVLQGVAEPFPISSLGHGVILPRVLGWDIHQNDDFFLSFLVATHLATALPPGASTWQGPRTRLGFRQAAAIGTAQAIGLIPGMSRSGATMSAGIVAGLGNADAARFAFLLATPIIGAAALLKLPDLLGPAGNGVRGPALVGAVCAGMTTWLAVKFLLRFFETNRLTPFGAYCIVAGVVLTLAFAVGL